MTMVKVRQDAWSHEDDLLLAETVLRHIREGSTQLKAFDEVGDHLNRTSAACGFRWNAEIRQKYISAIDMAKRQRKEKKRALAQMERQTPIVAISAPTISAATQFESEYFQSEAPSMTDEQYNHELDIDDVISYLMNLKAEGTICRNTTKQIELLEQEKQQFTSEIEMLERELTNTKQQLSTIQEDYNAFIRIMDRARKMAVYEEESNGQPEFRMDQNGNLQQVAQNSN